MGRPVQVEEQRRVMDPKPNKPSDEQSADTTSAAQGEAPTGAEDQGDLLAKLAEAQQEANNYKEQLMRLRADVENVRRRTEREMEGARKYALERFAGELLPVRDSLEMGLQAASVAGTDLNKVREGVDLTLKMLSGVLEKFGVTEVNPQNQRFNPEQHQAMTTQESADVEPNTVVNVYQKGYLLNDRLLRPALVVVSKAATGGQSQGPAAPPGSQGTEPGQHIDESA